MFFFFGTPTINELTYDVFNKFLAHFSHYKHKYTFFIHIKM
jgi:hypothetical protein